MTISCSINLKIQLSQEASAQKRAGRWTCFEVRQDSKLTVTGTKLKRWTAILQLTIIRATYRGSHLDHTSFYLLVLGNLKQNVSIIFQYFVDDCRLVSRVRPPPAAFL